MHKQDRLDPKPATSSSPHFKKKKKKKKSEPYDGWKRDKETGKPDKVWT